MKAGASEDKPGKTKGRPISFHAVTFTGAYQLRKALPGKETFMSKNSKKQTSALASFDPDAMRERYRIEREKRLRSAGIEQYIQVSGQFAKYLDDPYAAGPIAFFKLLADWREAGAFEGLEFGP